MIVPTDSRPLWGKPLWGKCYLNLLTSTVTHETTSSAILACVPDGCASLHALICLVAAYHRRLCTLSCITVQLQQVSTPQHIREHRFGFIGFLCIEPPVTSIALLRRAVGPEHNITHHHPRVELALLFPFRNRSPVTRLTTGTHLNLRTFHAFVRDAARPGDAGVNHQQHRVSQSVR